VIRDPAAVIAELTRRGSARCLLCGRRPIYVGYWSPTPAYCRKLGAGDGKARVVSYLLCKKCVRRPNIATRVEDKILREAAAMLATAEAN
jgi:hypothetical protein